MLASHSQVRRSCALCVCARVFVLCLRALSSVCPLLVVAAHQVHVCSHLIIFLPLRFFLHSSSTSVHNSCGCGCRLECCCLLVHSLGICLLPRGLSLSFIFVFISLVSPLSLSVYHLSTSFNLSFSIPSALFCSLSNAKSGSLSVRTWRMRCRRL